MIQLKDVTKTHINSRNSKVEALKGINLELPSKGFMLLVGDNGSGKSTLLSILGCLDSVTSGQFLVDGRDFAQLKQSDLDDWRGKDVAFVFQEYNLLQSYTVAENIRLGKTLSGETMTDEEISKLLKKVRLEGFEHRYPKDLSGGERQKVAVARALARNPRLILVDEPTAQADEQSTISLLEILKEISKNILVVIISHKTTLVTKYADRIIELNAGKIASDTKVKAQTDKAAAPAAVTRQAFHWKSILTLGLKNFTQSWGKAAVAVCITTLSLFFFASSIMLSGYNHAVTLAKDADGKHPYYAFSSVYVKNEVKQSVTDRIGEYILLEPKSNSYGIQGIIKTQDPTIAKDAFGRDFSVVNLSTLDKGLIITDYVRGVMCENERIPSFEFDDQVRAGTRKLKIYQNEFIVAGVVKTDYDTYKGAIRGTKAHEVLTFKMSNEYAVVFGAGDIVSDYISSQQPNSIQDVEFTIPNTVTVQGSIYRFQGQTGYMDIANGVQTVRTLRPGEIMLGSYYFLKYVKPQVDSTGNYYIMLQIGQSPAKQYKVVAYYYDTLETGNLPPMMVYMHLDDFTESLGSSMFPTTKLLFSANISESKLAKIITRTEGNTDLKFESVGAQKINNFSEKVSIFQDTFLAFAILSLVISIIFLYNFITNLIMDKKKDIGILRSLGGRSSTIIFIFMTTMGIMAGATIVLAASTMFIASAIINSISAASLGFGAAIAVVKAYNVFAMIGLCALAAVAGTVLPIWLYSKQTPIKQLKK
jgi:ABC-type lipoprotein export system ATPase subunit/ABC-type antimicrobial peptide transport system permease subunit